MNSKNTGYISRYFAVVILQILIVSNSNAAFWTADNSSQKLTDSDFGRVFNSELEDLRHFLGQVPDEISGQTLIIDLPMPDGSLAAYEIFESSIMQPELASKFPGIRSFVVRGVNNPGSTGRVDISQKGFRGMIYTPFGRVFIDPLNRTSSQYVAKTSGSGNTGHSQFQCSVGELESVHPQHKSYSPVAASRIPGRILAYRLAVSATPEYVAAVSTSAPSLIDAMAEINTAINRVNQIYERDLGIRLFLVAGNDLLIDINGEAGFDNEFPGALLEPNQQWIDSKIKPSGYDIGHIFSTGAGGVAQLSSVCGPLKAQGASGLPDPADETFYVDYVAHEIGHQFGANHTFNGSTGSCGGGNRNADTAYEPGSGSTIMSYAGICGDNTGDENLQFNSEATFHAGTIAEINTFVSDANTGGSCASSLALSASNNDPGIVSASADKTIPVATPFRLVGSASDADGDVLSYQWDQFDAGATETTAATFNTDQGDNPLFRSYVPQSSPERHFPALRNQLGISSLLGEILPVKARDLNFRLTVRDCKSGQATDDVTITVDTTSGPFVITSHSTPTSFPASSSPTVIWNVANTRDGLPNCPNVDIDLLSFSTDKSTYAVINLVSATPNDGSQQVQIDDRKAPVARFRVSCSDNVFYDISDADLTIEGTLDFPTTGNTTAMSPAGICGDIDVVGIPTGVGVTSDSGGGGSVEWQLLLLLSVIAGSFYVRQARFRAYIQS